jgi:hypothetical protein
MSWLIHGSHVCGAPTVSVNTPSADTETSETSVAVRGSRHESTNLPLVTEIKLLGQEQVWPPQVASQPSTFLHSLLIFLMVESPLSVQCCHFSF